MKKLLPVIIVILILLLLGAIFVQLKDRNTSPPVDETPTGTPPPIEYFGGVVPLVPSEAPRVVSKSDNSFVSTTDFRQLPKIVSVGQGFYSLNGADPAVNLPYSILYSVDDDSFTISLDATPLAVARERVSEDLLVILDITEKEACELNVYVGVTYYTDKALSGKNLGLSFCPDRIDL